MSAEALRGGGGADSFVQFPLEKSSRKVYNYSALTSVVHCLLVLNTYFRIRHAYWFAFVWTISQFFGLQVVLNYLQTGFSEILWPSVLCVIASVVFFLAPFEEPKGPLELLEGLPEIEPAEELLEEPSENITQVTAEPQTESEVRIRIAEIQERLEPELRELSELRARQAEAESKKGYRG